MPANCEEGYPVLFSQQEGIAFSGFEGLLYKCRSLPSIPRASQIQSVQVELLRRNV
jgi:hypothetical protein